MKADQPTVYIAVLNWHSADKTIRCLDSLRQLDYPHKHMIVVDNASRDDSVERIGAAHPAVDLIVAPANLGYAAGNELALRWACELDDGGGLFWVLNNDSLVPPGTLSAFVAAYRQHGKALYGGVNVGYDADMTDPANWRVKMRVWENGRYRLLRDVPYHERYPTTEPRTVAALSGSSLLVPLSIIKQHGFIDTSYFLYCEDEDYCFRLQAAGVPSIEVPRAVTLHYSGGSHKTGSRSTLQPIITYYRARNKIRLRRKFFGSGAYIKAIATQLFFAAGWFVLTVRRGPVALRSSWFTLLGIRDALRGRTGKTFAPEDYLSD